MEKVLITSRLVVIFVLMAVLIAIFSFTLYRLQVIEGTNYLIESTSTITAKSTLPAARGAILDRNGVVLVDNITTYNLTLSRSLLLKMGNPNEMLTELIGIMDEHGIEHNDAFPVTRTGPFSYSMDITSEQKSRLLEYYKYFGIDENISAPDLISWLREHYSIDYTVTPEDARTLIGIRYELELRAIININEYIFAENVDLDLMAQLLEKNFPFVNIVPATSRAYHTEYASHILGHIGLMNAEEYEVYKEQGYAYDSRVGKGGVEYSFESYLHGSDGYVTTTYDTSGAVVNQTVTANPVAGQNVYLTIDIELQQAAEEALANTITSINLEREETDEELAVGGAAVVIDVKTGDSLAIASYPGYEPGTYNTNYTVLSKMENQPLFNRATHGIYNPGSTFKPVTALAALMNQSITPLTTIYDAGVYTEYLDVGFSPRCWIYTGFGSATHNTLDVVGALEHSCNYFFYTISDWMGIKPIYTMAERLGLGVKTGIEISEAEGHTASPEYKQEALDEGWWAADTVLAGIGQGHNYFTPIQMAMYTATIANGGDLYEASVLKYITTHDFGAIVYEEEPTIRDTIDDPEGYFGIIQSGMEAVAKTGTAKSVFSNYPVKVAAKTGTVQSDTAEINNGVFICYAPADDPEIAVAVVVEKGGSGAGIMSVAKDILDAYFAKTTYNPSVSVDNSLVK